MNKAPFLLAVVVGVLFVCFNPDPPPGPVAKSGIQEIPVKRDFEARLAKRYLKLLGKAKQGVQNFSESKKVQKLVKEVKELGPVVADILRKAFAAPLAPPASGEESKEDLRVTVED